MQNSNILVVEYLNSIRSQHVENDFVAVNRKRFDLKNGLIFINEVQDWQTMYRSPQHHRIRALDDVDCTFF